MVVSRGLIVAIVIAVVALLLGGFFGYKSYYAVQDPSGGASSKWTVYGTNGCGWTRKQLKELDEKGVPYTYVNCENGGDCGGIKSFPTLKSDSGDTKVGFTTF